MAHNCPECYTACIAASDIDDISWRTPAKRCAHSLRYSKKVPNLTTSARI